MLMYKVIGDLSIGEALSSGGTLVLLGSGVIAGTTSGFGVSAAGRSFVASIFGSVTANGYGIHSTAGDSAVHVGKTGSVFSTFEAIWLQANSSNFVSLRNEGSINGIAPVTVHLEGSKIELVNTGTISNMAGGSGATIKMVSTANGFTLLNNSGTIVGSPTASNIKAIEASVGRDVIYNSGTIIGTILLGDGDDHYDGRRGFVEYGSIDLGQGRDIAFGGEGSENFVLGSIDDDQVNGGGGADSLNFMNLQGSITIDLRIAGRQKTGLGFLTVRNVENVTGGRGNDRIIGNAQDNSLWGFTGDDTLEGGAGDDTLSGGGGSDVISYRGNVAVRVDLSETQAQDTGLGWDVISYIDNVIGSSRNDVLIGNENDNLLEGGFGNDTLMGGDGIDMIGFSGPKAAVVNLALESQITGYGTDTLISIEGASGGTGNDRFTGNNNANRFIGNNGHDLLMGLGGNDTLAGGRGNDTLNGGEGIDVADYSGLTDNLNLTVKTGQYTLTIQGTDVLNSIEGFIAGSGHDTLTANAFASYLDGGEGNDTLMGGAGNDTLIGGFGTDRLTGGAGADIFRPVNDFRYTGPVRPHDVIVDFEAGLDKIDLSIIKPFSNSGRYERFIQGTAPSRVEDWNLTVGDLFYDRSQGILYLTYGGGSRPDLEIHLTPNTALSFSDLIL